ncbi:hypothetical protein DIPPA_07209 [Diplonema papillatum]|nr:hypothetical protein DIPPA_07209 [Diplonema papillatum]
MWQSTLVLCAALAAVGSNALDNGIAEEKVPAAPQRQPPHAGHPGAAGFRSLGGSSGPVAGAAAAEEQVRRRAATNADARALQVLSGSSSIDSGDESVPGFEVERQLVKILTGVATGAAAASVVVGGGGLAATSASRLALLTAVHCGEREPGDLVSWETGPTGLVLGGGENEKYVGGVVGNLGIVVAVTALHVCAVFFAWRFGKAGEATPLEPNDAAAASAAAAEPARPSLRRALEIVRFPHFSLLIPTLCFPGIAAFSASLALYPTFWWHRLVGVGALVGFNLGFLVLLWWKMRGLRGDHDWYLVHRSRMYTYALGPGEWIPDEDPHFFLCWGMLFCQNSSRKSGFLIADIAQLFVVSCLVAVRSDDCFDVSLPIGLLLACYAVFSQCTKPWAAPLDNHYYTVSCGLQAAAYFALSSAYRAEDPGGFAAVAHERLMLASAGVVALKSVLDVLITLHTNWAVFRCGVDPIEMGLVVESYGYQVFDNQGDDADRSTVHNSGSPCLTHVGSPRAYPCHASVGSPRMLQGSFSGVTAGGVLGPRIASKGVDRGSPARRMAGGAADSGYGARAMSVLCQNASFDAACPVHPGSPQPRPFTPRGSYLDSFFSNRRRPSMDPPHPRSLPSSCYHSPPVEHLAPATNDSMSPITLRASGGILQAIFASHPSKSLNRRFADNGSIRLHGPSFSSMDKAMPADPDDPHPVRHGSHPPSRHGSHPPSTRQLFCPAATESAAPGKNPDGRRFQPLLDNLCRPAAADAAVLPPAAAACLNAYPGGFDPAQPPRGESAAKRPSWVGAALFGGLAAERRTGTPPAGSELDTDLPFGRSQTSPCIAARAKDAGSRLTEPLLLPQGAGLQLPSPKAGRKSPGVADLPKKQARHCDTDQASKADAARLSASPASTLIRAKGANRARGSTSTTDRTLSAATAGWSCASLASTLNGAKAVPADPDLLDTSSHSPTSPDSASVAFKDANPCLPPRLPSLVNKLSRSPSNDLQRTASVNSSESDPVSLSKRGGAPPANAYTDSSKSSNGTPGSGESDKDQTPVRGLLASWSKEARNPAGDRRGVIAKVLESPKGLLGTDADDGDQLRTIRAAPGLAACLGTQGGLKRTSTMSSLRGPLTPTGSVVAPGFSEEEAISCTPAEKTQAAAAKRALRARAGTAFQPLAPRTHIHTPSPTNSARTPLTIAAQTLITRPQHSFPKAPDPAQTTLVKSPKPVVSSLHLDQASNSQAPVHHPPDMKYDTDTSSLARSASSSDIAPSLSNTASDLHKRGSRGSFPFLSNTPLHRGSPHNGSFKANQHVPPSMLDGGPASDSHSPTSSSQQLFTRIAQTNPLFQPLARSPSAARLSARSSLHSQHDAL